ncbi:MAG: L-aspartate oxidase [Chloroflexaceae bacterium]|nr:L-aspartate oxidase [Chloroflexaceae bacterium]
MNPSIPWQNAQVDTPHQVIHGGATAFESIQQQSTDVLIIGGGVAGLTAALSAAASANVCLITRDPLMQSNSAQAQGGLAVVLDSADSPSLHIEDTLIAGAGLADTVAVATLVRQAPALIQTLHRLGMPFDRDGEHIQLGLEGGHSRRRIVHVGDATGRALMDTLVQQVNQSPRIHVLAGYQAIDLILAGGVCRGVLALDAQTQLLAVHAHTTILATGGAGALYGLTSNQPGALGEGIALAYRAGAAVADMEFVQFHPTVLRTREGRGFLLSEALRGEGARLLSPAGRRFMPEIDPRAELAPRDVVTRGILQVMQQEGVDTVYLDVTHLSRPVIEQRFPTIAARCREEGLDLAQDAIPVAPAAHYLMGGIATDLHGATSLPGLYAVGECACTGVHGANRLASNSLLECLVFGQRAGLAAAHTAYRATTPRSLHLPYRERAVQTGSPHGCLPADWRTSLAAIMRNLAAPRRSGDGLAQAWQQLASFPLQAAHLVSDAITLANAALVARLIVAAALVRQESRGAHFRTDFAQTDPAWACHLVWQREQRPRLVETIASEPLPLETSIAVAV